MVQVSRQHKALVLPFRKDVANLIPHARHDNKHMVVPHRMEETRLLRNLGIPVPAPILSQYDWGDTTPFDNQKETAALLTTNRRVFVLSEMGVGKTRAVIYAIDHLFRTGEAKSALIVAPLSTLNPTWRAEFLRVMPTENVVVLHGSRERRIMLLKSGARICIINHDGVETIQSHLLQCAFDIVVPDELLMYRNPRTNRWRMLAPIVQKAKFTWGLTGAPTPNSPLDAYGQIKLLTPSKVGRYTHFRDGLMRKVSTFLWVPRSDAVEKIHALMQPSVRFKLRDCVDIPETTYSTRTVNFSPVQQKFYDAIFRHAHAEYKNHQITAVNEGVKLGKLLQIACGYVISSDGKVLGLKPDARINEVIDIIRECGHKVIVFVPYIAALKQVYNRVLQHFPAHMVYGGTPKNERDKIFYDLQNSPDVRVLVAQPKAMSHGLTLTQSKVIIWYAPTHNLDTYIQANARIVRVGQDSKTAIIHLEGSRAEQRVYKRLQNKEKLQGTLLELFDGVNDV